MIFTTDQKSYTLFLKQIHQKKTMTCVGYLLFEYKPTSEQPVPTIPGVLICARFMHQFTRSKLRTPLPILFCSNTRNKKDNIIWVIITCSFKLSTGFSAYTINKK